MTGPVFGMTVGQNKYLATVDDEMHAVLRVTAQGLDAAADGGATEAAEVIAIDCSGSMGYPPTKISAARHATAAAIDALRDGVYFAVIEGTDIATVAYPREQRLVPASPETREAAKAAVKRLQPNGGTAMGRWLWLARSLLAAHPAAVRHVMMLSDGRNETESRLELERVLGMCEGEFVCDARGIGDNWSPEELLRIVSVLKGSADGIREHGDLVADFADMMHSAMSKVVPDLRLRIMTPPYARVRFVKQTFPVETDLTEFGTTVDNATTVFSTGSWGDERREFHICLQVAREDMPVDEDILAARISLAAVRDGEDVGADAPPVAIRVHWTGDLTKSSVMNSAVARALGQTELGETVMAGCEAYDAGNPELAAQRWGQALKLAVDLGNDKIAERMRRLIDEDPDGTVRVKPNLRPEDLMRAAMSSGRSGRTGPQVPPL